MHLNKHLKRLFILLLVFSWLLTSYPPIWQNPRIPPKIEEAKAVTDTFTSSGTWTAPSGVTSVTAEVWGGGGGGASRTSGTGSGAGSGGGGAYSKKNNIAVTPGTGYTVTVGTGGGADTAGGDSYFIDTSTVLAKGGSAPASNSNTGASGGAAASGVGDTKFSGGNGGNGGGFFYGSGGGGGGAGDAANGGNGGNGSSSTGGAAGTGGSAGGGNGGAGIYGSATTPGNPGNTIGGAGSGGFRWFSGTGTGGSGARGEVRITYTFPTYEQSAYRLFNNDNSTNVGTALAAQDTAATLGSAGAAFRLRMLLHIGIAQLGVSGKNFKLQFAQQSGTCDTGFVGETYADVTAATVIAYNNNATPADGDNLTANASDPTHGADTIVNQDYEELNNFTNSVAAIPAGQDGKWDFALIDNGATADTAYCLRTVKSDATVLDTYTVIPQITTASVPPTLDQPHYRWRNDDGGEGGTAFSALTSDGYLQASNASYTTAHDASSGTVYNTEDTIRVGQQLTAGTYYIDRSTLFFDTSAIPDGATITSAKLTLDVSADNSATDFDIQVQRPTLTLDEKQSQQYTVNSRHIHGFTWDGSQYLYGGMRESADYPLIKIDKNNLSTYTEYDTTVYNCDNAIYWNNLVYLLCRRNADSIAVLMEFNPTTAAWTERVAFDSTGFPGGLVYAFGYMWAGQQPNVLRKINTADWSYTTYTYSEMSANLHWVGANSSWIWITGYPAGGSPVIRVDPSNPASYTSTSTPYLFTDDQAVDDSYLYLAREQSPTIVRRIDTALASYTDFTFSGTDVSYGIFHWDFTNIYGESESWLAFITALDDKIIWVEKPSITEVNRIVTNPPTNGDAPNEVITDGDYLYVTFWDEDPQVVKKYRLDKPEIQSPLEAADYDKKYYRKNGGTLNTTSISGTGYTDISLNATGINWINKTGTTILNLRSSRDINSNTPTGNEYVEFYSGNKGSGYEPVLTVTYQTPATWKAAEDTAVTNQAKNENVRLRFSIKNTGGTASGYQFKLQASQKTEATCEAQTTGWSDVPTTAGAATIMTTSSQFADGDPTTRQLTVGGIWVAGRMVEYPSNQTAAITIGSNYFTENEYNFQFTSNALDDTAYCLRLVESDGTTLDTYTVIPQITAAAAGPTNEQLMWHGKWFSAGAEQPMQK